MPTSQRRPPQFVPEPIDALVASLGSMDVEWPVLRYIVSIADPASAAGRVCEVLQSTREHRDQELGKLGGQLATLLLMVERTAARTGEGLPADLRGVRPRRRQPQPRPAEPARPDPARPAGRGPTRGRSPVEACGPALTCPAPGSQATASPRGTGASTTWPPLGPRVSPSSAAMSCGSGPTDWPTDWPTGGHCPPAFRQWPGGDSTVPGQLRGGVHQVSILAAPARRRRRRLGSCLA